MKLSYLRTISVRLIVSLLILMAFPAFASEHGGGESSGGAGPLSFVVNVGSSAESLRMLQIAIVLEFATPAAEQRLAEIKPKVQHRLILLLSSEAIDRLQTVKGKQELQARILEELNGLIDETTESGIKEVFFTNFIIQ